MNFPCQSLSLASACRTAVLWAKFSVRKEKKKKKKYERNALNVTSDSIKMYNYKEASCTYVLKLIFLNSVLARSRCGKFPSNSAKVFALALIFKWFQAKPNFPRKFIKKLSNVTVKKESYMASAGTTGCGNSYQR